MKNSAGYLIKCYFIAATVLVSSLASAQQRPAVIDSVLGSMGKYAASHPSSTLFVHFDKTVYANFENVWFQAYLVTSDLPADSLNTLSVFLVSNTDRKIWAEGRFIMNNGLAGGNLLLPDSLPPGNFCFVAYSNRLVNGYPDDIFIQPVTVKTIEGNFSVVLSVAPPGEIKNDFSHILMKAYTSDLHPITQTNYMYSVGSQGRAKSGKTDKLGQDVIDVSHQSISAGNNTLHVVLRNGSLYKNVSLSLPAERQQPTVKFYPEGGNIIDHTPAIVGWEVKNDRGEPLAITGLLIENNKVIDTITTDRYGMGKFTVTADKTNNYKVKPAIDSTGSSAVYSLPVTRTMMPALSILNGVAGDTLKGTIKNLSQIKSSLFLMLHDYKNMYSVYELHKGASGENIEIPLDKIPKGLFVITLADENKMPLAERVCFAHYDRASIIDIKSDSSSYGKRKKVTLTIGISNKNGNNDEGVVSLACVQASRIEQVNMKSIVSYTYLEHPLSQLPQLPNLFNTENIQLLENLLLIKGWRRYTWQDMITAEGVATISTEMPDKVFVTRNNKTLKDKVELAVSTDSSVQMLSTDKTGKLDLGFNKLAVPCNTKLLMFVNGNAQEQYSINITNPYLKLNRKIAEELPFENRDINHADKTGNNFILPKGEYTNMLQLVTVTARNDNSFYGHLASFNGKCSDYVCIYNILNCPTHHFDPGNTVPINGHVYFSSTPGSSEKVIYSGSCSVTEKNEYLVAFDGIYSSKEFYATDLSNASSSVPEYLSTLYWKNAVPLKPGKNAVISFYTGDITGRFRVIIQGRTTRDVVYGEYSFDVRN